MKRLVLTRKPSEALVLFFEGAQVKVTVLQVGSKKARIAIDAPEEVLILRSELASDSKNKSQ